MAREAVTLSTARAIVASGKATKEEIVEKFDIIDDEETDVAPALEQPSNYRRATVPEHIKAGLSSASARSIFGIPTALALVTDIATSPVRRTMASGKTFLEGGSLEEAHEAGKKETLRLPLAEKTIRGAEGTRRFLRNKVAGVPEEAITDTTEEVFGIVGDIVSPVEGSAIAKAGVRGATRMATRRAAAQAAAQAVPKDALDDILKIATKAAEVEAPAAPAVAAAAPTPTSTTPLPKYAEPSSVNLTRLNIDDDSKQFLVKTAKEIAPDLEAVKGAPVTFDEVLEAAKTSSILTKATSREATKASEAALLRTRQHLAAMAEGKMTPEIVDTLRVVSAEATRRGRELGALKIGADPELHTIQGQVIEKLAEIGKTSEEIAAALQGVDFTNAKEVTRVYRQFVKPKYREIIDEFRYINLLSSPRTHIVNAFSNMLQVGAVRPAVRLVSGGIDRIASILPGAERSMYVRQVPSYYRGVMSGFGEATDGALQALKGTRAFQRPELDFIPTGSKVLEPFQFVTRALEASDVFFRTLAEFGEREAITTGRRIAGKQVSEAAVSREAAKTAAETIFRKPLDPSNASGHGKLLATIDHVTGAVHHLRKIPVLNWFVPFVETPMNILKQGIEFSPAGLATMWGSTRKTEQLAKAMIGSTVFAGAGALALDGRTTWRPPRNSKDRAAFYEAGLQPYAVKIGDQWVSYSKLGPLAYPIAMAAAMKHYAKDDPESSGKPDFELALKTFSGIARFFSDQSYVDGLGNLVALIKDEEGAAADTLSSIPGQFVPLASLQRWVTNIVDPIYRKAERRVSLRSMIQSIARGIPGASTTVPPYLTPSGKPSRRQKPLINAVSPVNITEETKTAERYRRRERRNQRREERKRAKEERRLAMGRIKR